MASTVISPRGVRPDPASGAPTDVRVSRAERRLRVLFFTWTYYPLAAGGAERQARLQAEELVRRGHTVSVICPAHEEPEHTVIAGVDVRRLPYMRDGRPRRLRYFASIVKVFLRYGWRADVVHVHLANRQADIVVSLAKLCRTKTYVKVGCGGTAGEVRARVMSDRPVRWIGIRGADRVQALSRQIEEELLSAGVRAERIVSIENGLDLAAFRPALPAERADLRERLGLPVDRCIFLFAGRFATYKGLPELLDAWREMESADALLVLCGSSNTEAAVTVPRLPNLEVRDYTNEINVLMRAVDVLVYPSHSDGMSNAVLEGLASGLCVVTTPSGTTDTPIRHEVNGLLIPEGDSERLRQTMQRLVDDPALRDALADEARQTVSHLSIERVVDKVEGVYRRLLSPR